MPDDSTQQGQTSQSDAPRLDYVELNEIRVNPVSLRDANQKEQQFTELVDSIRSRGVITPINLRPAAPGEDGKKYELVDGLQRFTASSIVGTGVLGQEGKIPAQIMNRTDAEALLDQVSANAQRIETKPAQYSQHLRRILGYHPTWTVSQLAAHLNKSPAWVDKMLSLNKLTENIQKLVDDGKIQLVNAYALAQLPVEEQPAWLERAQTQPTNEFPEQATKRLKEIKEAARKGKSAEPEKFSPIGLLRNKKELEQAAGFVGDVALGKAAIPDATDFARDFVKRSGIVGESKDKGDAAIRGFQLALRFVLNLTPDDIKRQNEKWDADQKDKAEKKVRREAEKTQKQAEEAQQRAADAKKAAEEAAKKAATLPPVKAPEPAGAPA